MTEQQVMEELRHSEDQDASTRSTTDAEQRGLLSEKEKSSRYAGLRTRKSRSVRLNQCGILAFFVMVVGIISVLAILASSGLPFVRSSHEIEAEGAEQEQESKQEQEQEQSAEPVLTNDYILDPQWDFQAPPQRREYNWVIKDQEHNPDGVYRPMILVNNQFPGPLIEVNEGDTIVVQVDNQAVNATSIHWHGLYQNSTPWMDGTVGITQCPIAPSSRFTYEFTVSGQSGTYWWHAHQGLQSSDGLHGPLIIHGRDEKTLQRMHYDTDRVLLISDHYHDLSSALLWQYLKPDMENAEPVPVGGLLNGRSVRNCDEFPMQKCDNTTSNVGFPWLDLARGQSHRIRLINVGAFAEFQVQIDEHELAVTEVDGTDVEPMKYHRISINPAQRYSIVVESGPSESDSFWFRARMITSCFAELLPHLDPDVLAVVRYKDTANALPTSVDWEEQLAQQCNDMNTTDLVPVERVHARQDANAFFYLRSNFEIGNYRLSRGFFNSSSFRPSIRSPSLQRAVDGLSTPNDTFAAADQQTSVFVNDAAFDVSNELVIQTTGIQTIDFLISNFDDGNHPLHLHGYKYFVLAQGHGYPPLTHVGAEISRESLAPLYESIDFTNPLRRDTASVEAFGWILIQIVADNPGAWALHCHVAWHSEAGLLMQLLTRTDQLAQLQVPQANLDLCMAHGIERGTGPADEDYREFAK